MDERVNKLKICIFIILFISFVYPASSQTAGEWVEKGNTFGQLGEYDKAIEAYNKAIAIDPNFPDAWSGKGFALTMLGKYDKAIEAYNKAIDIDPKEKDAWFNKGGALAMLGKYDKAIEAYNKAIAIDPNYKEAWYSKGIVLTNLGEYDKAIEAHNKAIAIDPNFPDAWFGKGNAFGMLGEYNKALEAFDKALDIDPNFKEARENKELTTKRISNENGNSIKSTPEKWPFWKSIIMGVYSLSYWEVWVAMILYMVMTFAHLLITSKLFGWSSKESQDKPNRFEFGGYLFYIISGPALQGIMTAFVVAYLSPLILFGDSAAPISWIIENIGTICIIGIVSIIIATIIGSIPIINIIFQYPPTVGFLAGVIVFRFLSIDAQSYIYPGILASIGFLIAAYLISYLSMAVGYITLSLIFKIIMPSKNDEDIEGWLTMVLSPVGILAGMLPVFMYISYVRLSLQLLFV